MRQHTKPPVMSRARIVVLTLCMALCAVFSGRGAVVPPYRDMDGHADARPAPRGVQELLFSLSHIHADSLNVPLSSQVRIFSGYAVPGAR